MKISSIKEKIMESIFLIFTLTSIIVVFLICLFLLANGVPAIAKIGLFEFLLGRNWAPSDIPAYFGILPMILGSIYITIGAMLFGLPIGILTSVFMAFYCPKSLYKVLKPATELLAGIPSVIYGFFGLVALVPLIRQVFPGNGSSILTASILLGIMILPTIIGISEAAMKAVPKHYYEGAVALGTSREKGIFFVVLPAAKSGILTAVVMGIGRAIGETMAVVMVAGNQARMPAGIFKGVRTLTANIVIEMGYAAELHRQALIATALILFIFILIINILFLLLKKGEKYYE